MGGFFVKQILNCLKKERIIDSKMESIYLYGTNQALFIVLNLFITFCIGIISGKDLELLFFILQFIILRSFSGGYHANNPLICTIISVFMQIIALLFIQIIHFEKPLVIIFTVLISAFIAKLSPIEAKNKPLDCIEKKYINEKQ